MLRFKTKKFSAKFLACLFAAALLLPLCLPAELSADSDVTCSISGPESLEGPSGTAAYKINLSSPHKFAGYDIRVALKGKATTNDRHFYLETPDKLLTSVSLSVNVNYTGDFTLSISGGVSLDIGGSSQYRTPGGRTSLNVKVKAPAPSPTPTPIPTTAKPTTVPTTAKPTTVPTTVKPTTVPTTAEPTTVPTTAKPTPVPTTAEPTPVPTKAATPTPVPTKAPTPTPQPSETRPPYKNIEGQYITKQAIEARSGPGLRYDFLKMLPAGTVIEPYGLTPDGYYVCLINGKESYIAGSYLKPYDPSETAEATESSAEETKAEESSTPEESSALESTSESMSESTSETSATEASETAPIESTETAAAASESESESKAPAESQLPSESRQPSDAGKSPEGLLSRMNINPAVAATLVILIILLILVIVLKTILRKRWDGKQE